MCVEESNGNCSELTKQFAKIGPVEGIPKTVSETCLDLSTCRSNHGFACRCFFHCSIISLQPLTKLKSVM